MQRRPDDRSSRAACCPTLLNAERITVDGTDLPRFAEQAIDFQLEHVDASVAAVYNRDQRLPERTKMMQFWADKIDALRDGGSVVARPPMRAV